MVVFGVGYDAARRPEGTLEIAGPGVERTVVAACVFSRSSYRRGPQRGR